MIITRSPLRITLGGGGTDLPSYYRRFGGFLISAAIDKYIYITLSDAFREEITVKYSKLEVVHKTEEIQHPIIRECLTMLPISPPWVDISSSADVPAGTGMGSSGSFTTALLKAVHARRKTLLHTDELAEQACHIELDRLGEPIGKQDQYIAAFGGLTCFEFNQDDSVKAYPLAIPQEVSYLLEDNLLLFFTNTSRSASAILKDQDEKSKKDDSAMLDNMHFTKELGYQNKAALEKGDLAEFARLMNVHWEHKRKRSGGMSNPQIDAWYELGLKNGAAGGKLIGAGGGGFLMFYCDEKAKLRQAMKEEGLREVRFRFDFEGTKILVPN